MLNLFKLGAPFTFAHDRLITLNKGCLKEGYLRSILLKFMIKSLESHLEENSLGWICNQWHLLGKFLASDWRHKKGSGKIFLTDLKSYGSDDFKLTICFFFLNRTSDLSSFNLLLASPINGQKQSTFSSKLVINMHQSALKNFL